MLRHEFTVDRVVPLALIREYEAEWAASKRDAEDYTRHMRGNKALVWKIKYMVDDGLPVYARLIGSLTPVSGETYWEPHSVVLKEIPDVVHQDLKNRVKSLYKPEKRSSFFMLAVVFAVVFAAVFAAVFVLDRIVGPASAPRVVNSYNSTEVSEELSIPSRDVSCLEILQTVYPENATSVMNPRSAFYLNCLESHDERSMSFDALLRNFNKVTTLLKEKSEELKVIKGNLTAEESSEELLGVSCGILTGDECTSDWQ